MLATQGVETKYLYPANIKYLSPQERRTLQLLCDGYTLKEAAHIMGVSIQSIKSYTHNARNKFKVQTTYKLIAEYCRGGIE